MGIFDNERAITTMEKSRVWSTQAVFEVQKLAARLNLIISQFGVATAQPNDVFCVRIK